MEETCALLSPFSTIGAQLLLSHDIAWIISTSLPQGGVPHLYLPWTSLIAGTIEILLACPLHS